MEENVFAYCPKCATVLLGHITNGVFQEKQCCCCGNQLQPSNVYPNHFDTLEEKKNAIKQLEQDIKNSSTFDETAYKIRLEKLSKIEKEYEYAPQNQSTQQNIPKCPTCGSTNVHKISVGSKVVGFATVGVFSSNLGKTMKCDNCGYKW